MMDAKAEARKAATMVAADLLRDAFERKARPVVSIIDATIDAYEAALEKAGLVLVPREATDEMVRASGLGVPHDPSAREVYHAMIAAAEGK